MKIIYHRYDFQDNFVRAVSCETSKPHSVLYTVFYTNKSPMKVMKRDYKNEEFLPANWDLA